MGFANARKSGAAFLCTSDYPLAHNFTGSHHLHSLSYTFPCPQNFMPGRKKGYRSYSGETHRRSKVKNAKRMQRTRASLPKASRGGAGGAGSDTGDAGASPWQHTSGLPGAGRRGGGARWVGCCKFDPSVIAPGATNTHDHASDLVPRGTLHDGL